MCRLTIEQNVCDAEDNGVLILLSIKQLTEHPFVVRDHFVEIPEHFLDEAANTLPIHDRGVVSTQPTDEDLYRRELYMVWKNLGKVTDLSHELHVAHIALLRLDDFEYDTLPLHFRFPQRFSRLDWNEQVPLFLIRRKEVGLKFADVLVRINSNRGLR
jgi:hypothetical protein